MTQLPKSPANPAPACLYLIRPSIGCRTFGHIRVDIVVANCPALSCVGWYEVHEDLAEGTGFQGRHTSLGTALSGMFFGHASNLPVGNTILVRCNDSIIEGFEMPAGAPTALSINLADIFPAKTVLIGLQSRTKAGVIAELVQRLVGTGQITSGVERSLVETILARENMGSTALGNGVAFPHCRSSVTKTFIGALGIDSEGVAFDAVDKGPVQIVLLLVGPLTNREQHFDILGRISNIGRHKPIRLQLVGCRSSDHVNRVLREWDCDSPLQGAMP